MQLGLWLRDTHPARMASRSAMAAPEGTPSALLAPPQALQPLALARVHANLLQFACASLIHLLSVIIVELMGMQCDVHSQLAPSSTNAVYIVLHQHAVWCL